MLFQTRKNFVHLLVQYFYEIWPCIDSKGTTKFKTQKCSKDIIKIIHVTSVIQP